jgi:hypothetical protein
LILRERNSSAAPEGSAGQSICEFDQGKGSANLSF